MEHIAATPRLSRWLLAARDDAGREPRGPAAPRPRFPHPKGFTYTVLDPATSRFEVKAWSVASCCSDERGGLVVRFSDTEPPPLASRTSGLTSAASALSSPSWPRDP